MIKKLSIKIGHLYGLYMNTYGDNGNLICLKKRCEDRGMEVAIEDITYLDEIKKGDYDLYFFGGGQDQVQEMVAKDIKSGYKDEVKKEVERGVPLLSICGGYQLLGEYYKPQNGPKLPGLGIFQAYTNASEQRMIGNIVVEVSSAYGPPSPVKLKESEVGSRKSDSYLVGFENHSGKTYLKKDAQALGKVVSGFGNNGEDGTEGCIYKNAIGCYMHGSLLPKNPKLADWLIKKALEVKYGKEMELEELDDTLENAAHDSAVKRFK